MIKWIIIGPNETIEHERRQLSIHRAVSSVSQILMQSVKTKRQVQYKPTESDYGMRETIETPLSVGLALEVHQKTRSKDLIEILSSMNLCVNYKRAMNLKDAIANEIKSKVSKRDNVYVPSCISQSELV